MIDAYWRVGRKVGRTIYAQAGDEPSDDDVLIGVMDTPDLAAIAVLHHNAVVAASRTNIYVTPVPGVPAGADTEHGQR